MKKSASGAKKVIQVFETKIDENEDNNTRKDYKSEKIADALDDKYIEYKSTSDE